MRIIATLVFWSLLVFAGGGDSLLGQTRSASGSESSCRKFVQAFYDWYVSKGVQGSLDVALKYKPAAFSAELSRRLREDSEAQAKDKTGDIVGLDFDPFLGAQDTCDPFSFKKVTRTGAKCWVEVYGSSCEKHAEPDVIPELLLTKGHWVFVNFHYPSFGKHSDLLSELKHLRRDR